MNNDERMRHALKFYPDIRRRAQYMTRNAADADDLTQDVYLRFAGMTKRLDERCESDRGMRAVLLRIADNLWIDELRRRLRQPEFTTLNEAFGVASPSDDHKQIIGAMVAYLWLATLPTEQARALFAVYIVGIPQSEHAKQAGVSLGTVKARCRYGKASLEAAINAGR